MAQVVKTSMLEVSEGILKSLRAARNNIKTLSDQIADKECEAAAVHDQLNLARAQAFVKAATEVNPHSGKLVYPNIDSQRFASEIILKEVEGYVEALDVHREMLKDIQKLRNTVLCEHERRRDLRAKIELLSLSTREAND